MFIEDEMFERKLQKKNTHFYTLGINGFSDFVHGPVL
jgi:hypothetical protein